VRTLTIEPRGPFDLATARDFAAGFPAGTGVAARAAVGSELPPGAIPDAKLTPGGDKRRHADRLMVELCRRLAG
jgi:hypothetical protein